MKNNKLTKTIKTKVLPIIGAAAVTVGVASCPSPSSSCDCPTKAHLGVGEPCNCGGSGCDCTEQIHGYATKGSVSIPIFREGIEANVVTSQMIENIRVMQCTRLQENSPKMKILIIDTLRVYRLINTLNVLQFNFLRKSQGAVAVTLVSLKHSVYSQF